MWDIALARSLGCTQLNHFLPCLCGANKQHPWLRTVRKDKYENGKQTSRTNIQNGNTARKNVWHAVKPLRRSQTKAIGFTRCASLHVSHVLGAAAGRRGQKRHTRSMVSLPSWQSRGVHHCLCPIFHAAAGQRGQLVNVENEPILRDFLNFWTWQRQKRNKSARLPQYLNLTTSKAIQFCETSQYLGMSQNTVPNPGCLTIGGMIRGYDSGYDSWVYDSWVWFADLDLVFPCILHVWLFTHTYPEHVSTVGNYTMRGALWSWHTVDAVRAAVRVACTLCSWHVGAIAGCRCRVLLSDFSQKQEA